MVMNVDDATIQGVLKFYHKAAYREITDYAYAATTQTEITSNNTTIYRYTLPAQVIYLDENAYAVTYAEQKVEDSNVYFKSSTDDYFEYCNRYEWKRNQETEPLPAIDNE